jgi:hypothetical protein
MGAYIFCRGLVAVWGLLAAGVYLFTGGAGVCAEVPLRAAAVTFFRFAGKK